jgi:hypothetical protein
VILDLMPAGDPISKIIEYAGGTTGEPGSVRSVARRP